MRRNRNRNQSSNLNFLTPSQFQDAAARSLHVHQPTIMLPRFILAFVKHLVTSGALYPASQENLDAAPGRHFGDQFAFPHLQSVFELYDFDVKDKADRINIIHAACLSLLLVLRALFGLEGAWRFWNAMFEAAFGGVQVDFPSGSEPVATLKLSDPQLSPGWDADYGVYGLWTVKTLEDSVNEPKAMRYWQQASLLPEGSYPRVAIRGFLQLTHEMGHSRDRRIDGYGDVYESIVFDVANKNRGALAADFDPMNSPKVAGMRALFGDTVADPEAARAWGEAIGTLRNDPLNMTPTYPIEGEGIGQLSRLHAIQRYGFIRSGGMPHMGLDLPAKQGTPVLAMYGGVVTGSVSGWEPGDGPKGNFVVIKSKLEDSNDTFLHEYYHLADTKLERGDVVSKGDVIGWVGSTGNSTGPHLHLATRWNRASSDGRSYERKTINPERVIEVGAVDAASEQGLGFGSPARPHLAIPMYILGTISGSSYASPVPPHVVQQLAAGSPQPDPEPVIGGNAGVPHLSNRVKRDDNTERRETIKTAAKEGAKRAAPSVAAVALTAALSSAGVPAPVAAVIASIVKTVLEQQVNGSPDDIIGAVRATVPDWGMPLDEAEKVMIQVANWISQNIQ